MTVVEIKLHSQERWKSEIHLFKLRRHEAFWLSELVIDKSYWNDRDIIYTDWVTLPVKTEDATVNSFDQKDEQICVE